MDTTKQIEDICNETGNTWFLTHSFPQLALYDLKCYVEIDRLDNNLKLKLLKTYEDGDFIKSKWIIPDKIDGLIPGFILIKCHSREFDDCSHHLYFACVRPQYRRRGILKSMINCIPKEWNIWLEASSVEIDNVEKIWEKCGFSYHTTINGCLFGEQMIYKRFAF
jgi:hypothetical protein